MPAGLRTLLETRDLDEAVTSLSGSYSPHGLCLAGYHQRFNARHNAGGFEGLSVHVLSYGSDVTATTEPFGDYILMSQVRRGCYRISSFAGERTLLPGEIVALDPHTAYTMDFLGDCEMIQMQIDKKS